MSLGKKIFHQAAAGEADAPQGLLFHLDANDEDSIESGGANTGAGSGTWFDIAGHDLNVPLIDKASNLQLHLNASDTTSYGGSGATWTDISGNSRNGTITDPVFESGVEGGLDFNSASGTSGDKVEVTHDAAFNTQNNMSFEVWVKRDSTSEGNIFFKGANNSGGGNSYFFSFNPSWGYYFYSYAFAGGGLAGGGTYSGTSGLNTGVYEHVIITIDGSGNRKIYVNGTMSANNNVHNATGTGSLSDTGPLTIGGYYPYAVHTGFDGRISVVRIYNTVLTASEVAQNYRAGHTFSYSSIYDTNLAMNLDAANYTSGAWVDSAGSNNGTVNGASFDKELGNFFNFDGSNDTITVSATDTAPINFSSETHAIAFWVNFNNLTNDDVVLGKFGGSNTTKSFQIQVSNSNKLTVLERDGSSNHTFETTGTFSTGTWAHFTYVRSASQVILYINGALDTTHSASNAINAGSTQDITIGNQASASVYFDGKLGQVKIYSATLTAAQVAQNYLATKNNYPNGYNATINGPTFTTNGSSPNESYFLFDGSDDYMTIPHNTIFDFERPTTLEIWVNKDGTGREWVIEKANGGSGSYSWQIEHSNTTSNYRFQMHNTSNAVATANVTSTTNTGTWYHIAVTHDGNNVFKIYLNGSLQESDTLSGTISKNTNGIEIGKYSLAGGYEFDGKIGMVKWHDRTFSATEVDAAFDSTKATYGIT